MRITQVILSKELGGAERHVIDLSNRLAQDHDLQVILRRPPGRAATRRHEGNISSHLAPGIAVDEVGGLFRNRRISAALRRFGPNVIHTHLGDAGKALRAVGPGIPLLATLHGRYKDKCYRSHDMLICIADWQRKTIPPDFPGGVVTIPNFVPVRPAVEPAEIAMLRERLGIPASRLVVGAVGRLSPEKGYDLLLRAFALADLRDAALVLVGDGPERSRLEAMAPPDVIFAGWQANPWPFHALFDLLVAPSRSEAFGITILEAMLCGTPVIATRSEGPGEILADGSGLLVDIDDANAMAEAMRLLATSPERRHDLSEKGSKKAASYRTDAIVPKIEALYRQLAS